MRHDYNNFTTIITWPVPPPPRHTLLHVLQQILDPRKGLLSRRQNLLRRQDESVLALVPQLRREHVIGADHIRHIIDAAAAGLVNGRTDGPVLELDLVDRVDGANGALG